MIGNYLRGILFAVKGGFGPIGGHVHSHHQLFPGGFPTLSGERVDSDTAKALSTYWACISNVSEDIAKLGLCVFKQVEVRAGKQGREKQLDHPVAKLLKRPNPNMTGMPFRTAMTMWALGDGNGYAEIRRTLRGPKFMDPINPHRVHEILVNGIVKYEVRRLTPDGNLADEIDTLQQHQMFHLKGPGNGLKGQSVAAVARDSIGLSIASQNFASAFFGNGSHIQGVLKTPKALNDTAKKNIGSSWAREYSGSRKAFRTAVLDGGMEWQPIGIPLQDAQFIEQRKFQVEEICRWFRVPPHKVQHLEKATFSNIESQNIEYVVDTLMPWAVRWEEEIDLKLLNGAFFSEHSLQSLMRGDSKARAEFYKVMWMNGFMTQNEIRAFENLDPMGPLADVLHVPLNMMPQTALSVSMSINRRNIEPPPDEPDDDEPEEKEDEEKNSASFDRLYSAAAVRIARKEINAVKHSMKRLLAGGSPARGWAHDFQRRHKDDLFMTFCPIVQTDIESMGGDFDMDNLQNVCNDISTDWLNQVLGAIKDKSFTNLLSSWDKSRAIQMAEYIKIKTGVRDEVYA